PARIAWCRPMRPRPGSDISAGGQSPRTCGRNGSVMSSTDRMKASWPGRLARLGHVEDLHARAERADAAGVLADLLAEVLGPVAVLRPARVVGLVGHRQDVVGQL